MSMDDGVRVRIDERGRLLIPKRMLEELGLAPGEDVAVYVDDGRLIVETDASLLKKLQSLFAHVPKERVLSEELVAERHAEAARELAEDLRDPQSRQRIIDEIREYYSSRSDVSLADELIRERREEARKEYAELGIRFPENLDLREN